MDICHPSAEKTAPRQRAEGSGTGCFLLTGHANQGHPEEQVDHPAPALRHTGDEGRDDDLGGHVELHGVREENPKGEEQLDSLVQPANEKEGTSEIHSCSKPRGINSKKEEHSAKKDFCIPAISSSKRALDKLRAMHSLHRDTSCARDSRTSEPTPN